MSIVIKELHPMDGYHERHFGTVVLNGNACTAVLAGPYDQLLRHLNTKIVAEVELNEITSVEVGLPKDDTLSGIFPMSYDHVLIDGSVHNEDAIDDKFSRFYIYIHNGADFLTLTSDDFEKRPEVDTRIRVVGKGLHVLPEVHITAYQPINQQRSTTHESIDECHRRWPGNTGTHRNTNSRTRRGPGVD